MISCTVAVKLRFKFCLEMSLYTHSNHLSHQVHHFCFRAKYSHHHHRYHRHLSSPFTDSNLRATVARIADKLQGGHDAALDPSPVVAHGCSDVLSAVRTRCIATTYNVRIIKFFAVVHAFTETLMAMAMSIEEKVIKMTPEEIILENEKPVRIVSGDHVVCTPVGGSLEDVGLKGRDIIFDTYGDSPPVDGCSRGFSTSISAAITTFQSVTLFLGLHSEDNQE